MKMTEKRLQYIFTQYPRKRIRHWAEKNNLPFTTQREVWTHFFGEGICACGNKTSWSLEHRRWREFCSTSCQSASKDVVARRRATCLKRFGVEEANLAPSVNRKKRKIFLQKYGVDNPSKHEGVKQKKRETSKRNFGKEHWTQAFLSRFDVDNPMWDEAAKEKVRATCLKRYGVDNASKSKEVIAKITKSMHAILRDPKKRKAFIQAVADAKQEKYGDPYAGHRFKTYDVEDHNGRIHSVQGYERFAIQDLAGRESVKSIKSRNVPRVPYEHNGDRTYLPDLVAILRSGERRLIEVKSPFTLRIDMERNIAKFQAAERMCAKNKATFWLALVKDSDKSVRWIKNPAEYAKSLLGRQ